MKIEIREINFEKEMTFSQILSTKNVEHWVEIFTYNHSAVRYHIFVSNLGNAFGWKDGNKIEVTYKNGRRFLGKYPIHRLVAKYFCDANEKGLKYNIHHINGNKLDDRACNLVQLTTSQHVSYERTINKPTQTPEVKAKISATQKERMKNPKTRAFISKRTKEGMSLAKQRKQQ